MRVNVDLASLPGPPGFSHRALGNMEERGREGGEVLMLLPGQTALALLCKLVAFSGSLHQHWPFGSVDLGHFGISFFDLLFFRAMGWSSVAQ